MDPRLVNGILAGLFLAAVFILVGYIGGIF